MSRRKKPTEYDKLRAVWYDKLKQEGFDDIEQDENNLKVWSAAFARENLVKRREAQEEYYRMAEHLLNNHQFETNLQRVIWEYHTNGFSKQEIVKTLKAVGIKDITFDKVRYVIGRLEDACRGFTRQRWKRKSDSALAIKIKKKKNPSE